MSSIHITIAEELSVGPRQVAAAIALLDEGSTVPFISRYRKEATDGLDDGQLRTLETRLIYLRELGERKVAIIKAISEQDKLTAELEMAINAADTKSRLEDLYLPYKKKRRTKGQIAREAGLEPLALSLKDDPSLAPEAEAAKYISTDKGVEDVKGALEGAKYILMELFAENADLVGRLRDFCWHKGLLSSRVVEGKEREGAKFRDYFEHDELIRNVPSHRALAMLRGFHEGALYVSLSIGDEGDNTLSHPCQALIAAHWGVAERGRPADKWLAEVVRWTWKVKLYGTLQTDLFGRMRESAETEAIRVFAANMKDLLLAAPAGHLVTIGLDPGLRTGVKVAVVDSTGKLLDHCAIYPLQPRNDVVGSARTLVAFAKKYNAKLVAIGNGTGSRETERFMAELIKGHPELGLQKIVVSEAGASVYSASELAANEFPDLDVTIRGAVSIARRLQDPLAELVKIDPKSIGVGQYQHDVSQLELARCLGTVVEDCVNAVGVDVNTASAPLLTRVSGLTLTTAENIVTFREDQGAFQSRREIKKVPRLGPKAFEQAAGFLRIVDGDNPLDASAVHPESYAVVARIAKQNSRDLKSIIADVTFLHALRPDDYTDERVGAVTVSDIIAELEKPGRDPRPEFKTAAFKEGVEKPSDLKEGMVLEGTVTNVTNFGAFVDVGVHQDGLVHISAISNRYIKDPREVVKTAEIVSVKVMSIDLERNRIALSMRLDDEVKVGAEPAGDKPSTAQRREPRRAPGRQGNSPRKTSTPNRKASAPAAKESNPGSGAFAALFAQAKQKKDGKG
jgi:uncharacterized protein